MLKSLVFLCLFYLPTSLYASQNSQLNKVSQKCVTDVQREYPFPKYSEAFNICNGVNMGCVESSKKEYPYPSTGEAAASCMVKSSRQCTDLAMRADRSLTESESFLVCDRVDVHCVQQVMKDYPYPEFVEATDECRLVY